MELEHELLTRSRLGTAVSTESMATEGPDQPLDEPTLLQQPD